MALPTWVAGARRPSMEIRWYHLDTTIPEDLTDATLTGTIKRLFGDFATRAISGTLTVTGGEEGLFRWDFSAEDVGETGDFAVQFSAAFGTPPTPTIAFETEWLVKRHNEVG